MSKLRVGERLSLAQMDQDCLQMVNTTAHYLTKEKITQVSCQIELPGTDSRKTKTRFNQKNILILSFDQNYHFSVLFIQNCFNLIVLVVKGNV